MARLGNIYEKFPPWVYALLSERRYIIAKFFDSLVGLPVGIDLNVLKNTVAHKKKCVQKYLSEITDKALNTKKILLHSFYTATQPNFKGSQSKLKSHYGKNSWKPIIAMPKIPQTLHCKHLDFVATSSES